MWQRLMSLFGKSRGIDLTNPPPPAESVDAVQEPKTAPGDDDTPVATVPFPAQSQGASAPVENAWWQPAGDRVIHAPIAASTLRPVDAELYAALSRAMDSPEIELPQMPVVAREVLALLRDENVNFNEAAAVAERDPVLTAEILRCVNSVMFRAVRPIERLGSAFPRLGVRRLRALLAGATMRSLAIRSGEAQGLGAQLWRSASASALIASLTAREVGEKEDEAYLAGLLHDIGNLMLLRVLHDYQKKSGAKITRSLFDALAQRWHEHLGLRLATAWELPDPLPELIGNHHRLPASDDPLARPRLILGFTDAVCALLKYEPYVPYDLLQLPVTQRLGIKDSPITRAFLLALPEAVQQRLN